MTRHRLAIAGIALGALLAFGNSLQSSWVADSLYIIKEDPRTTARSWNDDGASVGIRNTFTQDYWWTKGSSGVYRPLTTFSYWVNWRAHEWLAERGLAGKEVTPTGFHAVNLLIHVVAAILVYALVWSLTGRFLVAAFSGLLFAVHPITTEVVTNLVGRSDLFAAVSVLGGLLAYIRSIRANGLRKALWLAAVMVLAGFGFFSKEGAVALVPAIVVYDLIYRATADDLKRALAPLAIASAAAAAVFLGALALVRAGRLYPYDRQSASVALATGALVALAAAAWLTLALRRQRSLGGGRRGEGRGLPRTQEAQWIAPLRTFVLPWMSLAPPLIAMFLIRRWVFAQSSPPERPFLDNPIRYFDWNESISILANLEHWLMARLTSFRVAAKVLGLMVWPAALSADYAYDQIPLFSWDLRRSSSLSAVLSALLLLAIAALALRAYRRERSVLFLVLLALFAYLPSSNFAITITSIMGERFAYLPLVSFTAIVVMAADRIGSRWLAPLDGSGGGGDVVEGAGEGKGKGEDTGKGRTRRPLVLLAALTILAVAWGVRTHVRNRDWKTDEALWEAATRTSPRSFRPYQSLAAARITHVQVRVPQDAQGLEAGARGKLDEAIALGERALAIIDPLPDALNNTRPYLQASIYYTLKAESLNTNSPRSPRVSLEAAPWYRKAAAVLERSIPIDQALQESLRMRELRRGTSPERIPPFGLGEIYSSLAQAYARLGMDDEALEACRYAIHLQPRNPDHYLRTAMIQLAHGRPEDGARAFVQSVTVDSSREMVWNGLETVFRILDPGGPPASLPDPDRGPGGGPGGGRRLNVDRPVVRATACAAYAELVRILRAARDEEKAREVRDLAASSCGDGPALDALLTGPPEPVAPPRPRFEYPRSGAKPSLPLL